MDRRTLLFVLISVGVFVLWSVIQGPPKTAQERTTPAAEQSKNDMPGIRASGDTPGTGKPPTVALSEEPTSEEMADVPTEGARWHAHRAEMVRESAATTIRSETCEIEIAHATASMRSWRLLDYPMRRPKGRLGTEPVDLLSVYSPDYAGVKVNGSDLVWTPVGTPPDTIDLHNTPGEFRIAFQTRIDQVEVTKTFVFRTDTHEWFGYAVDVDLDFKNIGENTTDALTYELTWGPGITGDREPYDPHYGALGGSLTRAELPSFHDVRDRDVTIPGPQDKDGELVDMSNRRTIWAALDSKYFVAAILASDLDPVRGVERQAIFSEYRALDLPWDPERAQEREVERLRLLSSIGKDWMTNKDHLWSERTRRMLFVFPTGKMSVNDEILTATASVKDNDKALTKLEERLQRTYADYTTVVNMLSGTRLQVSGFFLDPGQSVTDHFRIYAGPKHTEMLGDILLPADDAPAHMNETVRLGFFAPVAKGLLWLLKLFHGLLRNYGAAIILLTIVVRGLLFPLSQHSSESMKRMQTRTKIIQPFLDEAKRKFKDDPQKMNSETMKIYRKYGVNPAGQLGGCLVMAAQMPIFIAMFQMLRNAAELRGEPFTLWITDLTAPDLLFTVAGVPIRVLPLFMTAGTILQQKMNPAAGTMGGSQRTMMYLMPLMFLFILYNMASGLNLYWGVSTILGVAQQYLVGKYGKSTGEENLTAADLERMATNERKNKRRRVPSWRP